MIRWFLNLFRRRRHTVPASARPAEASVEHDEVETQTPHPSPDTGEELPSVATAVRRQRFPAAEPPVLADGSEGAELAGNLEADPEPEDAAAEVPPVAITFPAPPAPAQVSGVDVVVSTFEIELPDLSGVDFVNPDHGYAPPPTPSKSVRRERRRTTLPPGLLRELVSELDQVGPRLQAAVAHEAVTVALPTSDAEPGYLVADLGEAFVVSLGESTGEARSLRHALTEAHIPDERPVDDLDRLELARLVAMAVDGLHRADAVLCRLDLDSFAFSVNGRPRVALVDGGAIRRLGGEFLREASTSRGFDDDRADFADIVSVLLSDGGDEIPETVPGLSLPDSRRLQVLRDRAAGVPGTRAPVSEWLEVLGR